MHKKAVHKEAADLPSLEEAEVMSDNFEVVFYCIFNMHLIPGSSTSRSHYGRTPAARKGQVRGWSSEPVRQGTDKNQAHLHKRRAEFQRGDLFLSAIT